MCSSSLEESGLGLLARFAASAIPSPVTSGPMSLVQLEAKQKAKKKEERQNLLGEHMSFYTQLKDFVFLQRLLFLISNQYFYSCL